MIKKVKILQAIRQGKIGGGETHVLDLVNNLDPTYYESVILSFTEGPMVDKLRADGFKTYVIHTEKPFNFNVWKKVKELIINENIDIIHAHGTRASSNTFSSASALGIPLIYTVHGWSFHPDQNLLVKMIRTWSERLLVKVADVTLCVSHSNLADGKMRFPMPNARVILNGINQIKFNPDQIYNDLRNELKILQDEVIVGYIARVTIQKDPLTFINAISKVPDDLKIKFLFVGDGDLKQEALRLARELQLESKIIFLNFREDVPAILNCIDIYCLPSLWEGLPIGVLEAMAMRKAVIATAIDGTKEIIDDHKNGLLIPVRSPEALAKAIISLSQNHELRTSLGIEARKTIKNNFNVKQMTSNIEVVYKSLLNK
jgi:glycosyltransferase involved in cell wall biosynthesis